MTAIRTPDQRLRIFVSSTMRELADARAAARRATEQLRLIPVLFELGARPYPPRELYLAYLRQSDVFIGIYGQQYGWIAPDQEISGLEDEYLNASDKPKLVYVLSPAPDRDPRLSEMLHRIQSDGLSYRGFRWARRARDSDRRRPRAPAQRAVRPWEWTAGSFAGSFACSSPAAFRGVPLHRTGSREVDRATSLDRGRCPAGHVGRARRNWQDAVGTRGR